MSPLIVALALTAVLPPPSVCLEPALVIGHRGSGSTSEENPFAENTIPSIRNAFDEGADMVEIDVQLSADGEVVLMHDYTVDKTTNLTGCVAELDYADLATADATKGSGASSPTFIPTLAEALDVVKKSGRRLNIELKVNEDTDGTCPPTDVDALLDAVVADVDGAGARDVTFFSSFSFDALAELEKRNADLQTGLLTSEAGEPLVNLAVTASQAGIDAVNPLYISVSEDAETGAELVELLPVYPWTVNSAQFMEKLLVLGVSGLITDDVPAARSAVDATKVVCQSPPVDENDEEGGCGQGSGPAWLITALLPIIVVRLSSRARTS